MGFTIEARCDSCGFQSEAAIGAGMANFTELSEWPAFCSVCDTMVSVNTLRKPIACFSCGSTQVTKYGDPALSDNAGREVGSWSGQALHASGHYCPGCKARTLTFGDRFGRPRIMFD